MKSVFLGIFSLIAFSTTSFTQTKAIQKAVIQTPGVQDEACKARITNFLSHEYGITSVKADYRKHTVTVQWLKDRTNIENIKTAVSADPGAYKRLPIACRHQAVIKEP